MKNSAGFTLVELIVTIVLVGILVGTAVPTFNRMVNETQSQTNISNMVIIKNVFMQYYYDNHIAGNPHFPQLPDDRIKEAAISLLHDMHPAESSVNIQLSTKKTKPVLSY